MGLYKNSQFIRNETEDGGKVGLFKKNHYDISYIEKLIIKASENSFAKSVFNAIF